MCIRDRNEVARLREAITPLANLKIAPAVVPSADLSQVNANLNALAARKIVPQIGTAPNLAAPTVDTPVIPVPEAPAFPSIATPSIAAPVIPRPVSYTHLLRNLPTI